jgi:hypothetical protein
MEELAVLLYVVLAPRVSKVVAPITYIAAEPECVIVLLAATVIGPNSQAALSTSKVQLSLNVTDAPTLTFDIEAMWKILSTPLITMLLIIRLPV